MRILVLRLSGLIAKGKMALGKASLISMTKSALFNAPSIRPNSASTPAIFLI